MSTKFVIPTIQSISSLLGMIFGAKLDVSDSAPADASAQYVAAFVSDEGQKVAICACDKSFVAYAAAALSMIPADVANEMISGSDLTEAIVGNFYEVMNICSKLLMSDSSAHLRLENVLTPGKSAEAIAALGESVQSIGFGVDIPRYGKGALTFLVT